MRYNGDLRGARKSFPEKNFFFLKKKRMRTAHKPRMILNMDVKNVSSDGESAAEREGGMRNECVSVNGT